VPFGGMLFSCTGAVRGCSEFPITMLVSLRKPSGGSRWADFSAMGRSVQSVTRITCMATLHRRHFSTRADDWTGASCLVACDPLG